MDEETERFQVAIAEHGEGSIAVLVDTATGRSWRCRPGARAPEWQAIAFAEDAPAAPDAAEPEAAQPRAAPRQRRTGG
jgi:hypothetical protein